MTRLELVEQVAKRAGVSQQMADKVLVAALESIIESVCQNKVVTLIGFGTFRAVDRAERVGRNPVTGEQIKIPSQRLPKFIPGTAFKDALRDDSVRQALEKGE
ncbi:MAG: HU family DNA-binding protein [Sutterella parvirubra]|uniref:DNA-binding protein HU-alpha n=1 Tax=Sutterella parvirubra YIT 11816 TaxID=762967 RepID=H3KCY4_9BURK|nr:HU family DNA-binding protein [Sutterella parvirubra]EHY32025.1 DNA-binding protein HU-alpha [Sutterella parvirubra YIT 11816]MCI7709255.1 HU family DNA-binding protein [Sutterella parvirubra]MDR3769841.1 HU family DNA-binding protein [Sutterella sp.]MDY5200570.1 HU family DNA-binding protein [Sutterella parvirubra]